MKKFDYEFRDGEYVVKDNKGEFSVLDISSLDPIQIKHYRELLSQKHDLERATAYLDQMFFTPDTRLIDGALMNGTIQLLIRCFTKSSTEDRMKFDYNKVFGSYAESIGEVDLTDKYLQFYNARNKVISHDELNFNNNIVGIVVNSNNTAVDITDITVSTTYVYKANMDLLNRLILIAKKYCEDQLRSTERILIDKYNSFNPKPQLPPIFESSLDNNTLWNTW